MQSMHVSTTPIRRQWIKNFCSKPSDTYYHCCYSQPDQLSMATPHQPGLLKASKENHYGLQQMHSK